jgi:hypothetical protein
MAERTNFSASERFRQIFEEIITTQPNTINQEQIEQLVALIINKDSILYALTDQYIQGEQTRIDPGRIALLNTPEFIQRIWGHISRTLISKLDEDIRTIGPTLPADYAQLDARGKCSHVRSIFVKLDDIHGNLFPGVVSFISHTLQGLFGSFKDEVNRNVKTATAQASEIEQLNKRTSKIISEIDNKIKSFAGDFVKFNSVRYGKILPEMCYYNDSCRSRREPNHLLQFIHKNGDDDDCWFESLQMNQTPIKQVAVSASSIRGSLQKFKSKSKRGGSVRLIRNKLVRTRNSRHRISTRRRRRSTKRSTRRCR